MKNNVWRVDNIFWKCKRVAKLILKIVKLMKISGQPMIFGLKAEITSIPGLCR